MKSSTHTISLNNNVIPYKIMRSAKRQKTISIVIRHPEGVVVRAPLNVRQGEITELLQYKTTWVLKKLAEIQTRNSITAKKYENGASLKYLGRDFSLSLSSSSSKHGHVDMDDKIISVHVPAAIAKVSQNDWVKEALRLWYLWQAKIIINKAVYRLSKQTGLWPTNIRVKELKSCWGVCSPKDNISFNWRLIMAPAHIIDYIVIHELCHIEQKNHSSKFYNLVSSWQPNYKEHRRELRDISTSLKI